MFSGGEMVFSDGTNKGRSRWRVVVVVVVVVGGLGREGMGDRG